MSEVTVIAPNVVEFAGNLARQSAPTVERLFPPPPPPPRNDPPLRLRNPAGDQSGRLAANQNKPTARATQPRTTSPGAFNLLRDPRRRPGLPSTQFLAQQIAQESGNAPLPLRPTAAIGAYEKARAGQGRPPLGEPLILNRSVDRTI